MSVSHVVLHLGTCAQNLYEIKHLETFTHGGSNEGDKAFKNKIKVFGPQVGWHSII